MRNLVCWAKVEDEYGNRVRGHMSRINSVVSALKEISETPLSLTNVYTEQDFYTAVSFHGVENTVAIVDNGYIDYPSFIPERSLVISDNDELVFSTIPKIINTFAPDVNIRFWRSPGEYTVYRGLGYVIVDPLVNKYRWDGCFDYVSLIPGGARDVFFANYNDDFVNGFVGSDTHVHVLENLPHDELLEEACNSRFVICPPSVVSLEMIAMGVPFAFIQTADDQNVYAKEFSRIGIVDATSHMELMSFIRDPQPIEKIIDTKHTYKLARHVHNMLMEKQQQ